MKLNNVEQSTEGSGVTFEFSKIKFGCTTISIHEPIMKGLIITLVNLELLVRPLKKRSRYHKIDTMQPFYCTKRCCDLYYSSMMC